MGTSEIRQASGDNSPWLHERQGEDVGPGLLFFFEITGTWVRLIVKL